MRERISVVYFTNSRERGGVEEHILTLMRGLPSERFLLHLICPSEVASSLAKEVPKNVPITELEFNNPRQFDKALALYRALKRLNPDILHCHLFYASLFASPVAKFAGVPIVVETPHIRELWRKGWKASFAVDRAVGRFVDHYIAISNANKRYLVEEKRLPCSKISVIQNGSDLKRFSDDRRVPAGLRQEFGIDVADPVIVVPARLVPQKGHTVLLSAAQSVIQRYPSVRFICIGDGALKAELEKKSRDLGVSRNFVWAGFQRNVQEWYALADIVALPSFFEGLPLALIEALACGRAVVATEVDGSPEVVIDGQTGLLVPPGDADALGKAIVHLLDDPRLRDRLGAGGRRWVTTNFSDTRQVAATAELYLKLLQQPPLESELFCYSEVAGIKRDESR